VADRRVDFLLIGGGMASAHCAAELRTRGADGSILLVGREPEPPYERPPLSKEYLRAEASRADAYVHEPAWYEENEVELLTRTNVLGLDLGARTAKVQKEGEIEFGKALLGTGARVNILHDLEGSQLEGIHYLRAFKNADEIGEEAADAERVVLVGGSYIACEVAASLTAKGKSCACVMLEDVALSRSFGEEVGRYFHGVLESHGVELYGGEEVEAFLGDGRVSGVRTRSGREVEGELVVVGAGVHPEAMLAERAGLEVRDGIVCDSRLETSADGVFAAGDVCSGSSTGMFRSSRGATPRGRCWGSASRTARCPTSSATSPTGPASSTSGPRPYGTRSSSAGSATRATSSPGTSRTARSPPPFRRTAPRTSPTPAACSRRGRTSPRTSRSSSTQTSI
jgi:3-phenylpropionate/trans-cinnamate dioxygenase ferredoxin reductase subunit